MIGRTILQPFDFYGINSCLRNLIESKLEIQNGLITSCRQPIDNYIHFYLSHLVAVNHKESSLQRVVLTIVRPFDLHSMCTSSSE